MSFDIAQTPTLQAVAPLDQHPPVQAVQPRAGGAVPEAGEKGGAGATAGAQRPARPALGRRQKAERALSQYTNETGRKLTVVRDAALDAIIQSAASGDKPDFKTLSELATLENRSRQASRAIERLVERLIPFAQLVRLREESHA